MEHHLMTLVRIWTLSTTWRWERPLVVWQEHIELRTTCQFWIVNSISYSEMIKGIFVQRLIYVFSEIDYTIKTVLSCKKHIIITILTKRTHQKPMYKWEWDFTNSLQRNNLKTKNPVTITAANFPPHVSWPLTFPLRWVNNMTTNKTYR